MISRRENLLIRPWQQRKYDNHRRKIQSALPAIDTKPPLFREHVVTKMKKQQKEFERCRKIERENYLLLQKMNYIMRTSRVDNSWRTPQPKFLNKIPVYDIEFPKIEDIVLDDEIDFQTGSRKEKCYACTPKKPTEIKIPEERVPWEPEKKPVSRLRSKSVPVRRETLPIIEEHGSSSANSSKISSQSNKLKMSVPKAVKKSLSAKEAQSIILTRGSLKLSVNFPSDTSVQFQEGTTNKMLMKGFCNCKNAPMTEVF